MSDNTGAIDRLKLERQERANEPGALRFGLVLADFDAQQPDFLECSVEGSALPFEAWQALDHCLQIYAHYAEYGQRVEWPEPYTRGHRINAERMGKIVDALGSIVAGMFCDITDCRKHAADTFKIKTPTHGAYGEQYTPGTLPEVLTLNLCDDHAPVLPYGNATEAQWIIQGIDPKAINATKGAKQ